MKVKSWDLREEGTDDRTRPTVEDPPRGACMLDQKDGVKLMPE